MKVLKTVLLSAIGLCLTGGAMPAHAWTAIAYSEESGVSYLYYMAKSAMEAQNEALAGCRRAASGCQLLGETKDGPVATVVVSGTERVVSASHPDPERALQQAMQACQVTSRECRLVSAAWDRGTHIMAIAVDRESAWVGASLPSEDAAREDALSTCRGASRDAAACAIYHVLNGPGWAAVARRDSATGVGISVRSSEIAVRNAVGECEKGNGAGSGACSDVTVFHNSAGTSEPPSYRELVQRIHRDSRAKTASVPPFLGKRDTGLNP